jgi:hypothetical protein
LQLPHHVINFGRQTKMAAVAVPSAELFQKMNSISISSSSSIFHFPFEK